MTAALTNTDIEATLSSEIVTQIRKLHFQTRRLATDAVVGQYRSAFKGSGIEFEEVREYVPGDDIRSIDWKVTARSGKPFIKSFREERELTVLVAVDISGSTHTGTRQVLRETLIAQTGAILTLIALNNNDKVGLLTYSNKVETYHPPRKGRNAVWRILTEVLSPRHARSGTDPEPMLRFLSSVLKRRAIVFFLSDFFIPGEILVDHSRRARILTQMQVLSRRHDVTVITTKDPFDETLPKVGLLAVRDPETEHCQLIATSNPILRKAYEQQNQELKQSRDVFLRSAGIGHAEFSSTDPFIDSLSRYFRERSRPKR